MTLERQFRSRSPERNFSLFISRLSTIKNADKIVVVKRGRVVEVGDHKTLTEKKGFYYDLLTAHQTDGDRLALWAREANSERHANWETLIVTVWLLTVFICIFQLLDFVRCRDACDNDFFVAEMLVIMSFLFGYWPTVALLTLENKMVQLDPAIPDPRVTDIYKKHTPNSLFQ